MNDLRISDSSSEIKSSISDSFPSLIRTKTFFNKPLFFSFSHILRRIYRNKIEIMYMLIDLLIGLLLGSRFRKVDIS